MSADPRELELLSYYRDAELHGATLLLRLMKLMRDDAEAQVNLTLHVAQEARHAWLWTKRIVDLGGTPTAITSGYQTRIRRRVVPHSVIDLLALTVVVETRSLARYREHAARSDVDDATRGVLRTVVSDERWHVDWTTTKLDALAHTPDARNHTRAMMERYRRIEASAYEELVRYERHVFGLDV